MKHSISVLAALVITGCSSPNYVKPTVEEREFSFLLAKPRTSSQPRPKDYVITMLEVARKQGANERVLFACTLENTSWPLTVDRLEGTFVSNDEEAQGVLQLEVDEEVISGICLTEEFSFLNIDHQLSPSSHKIRLILNSTHSKGDIPQVMVTKIRMMSEIDQDFLARSVFAD